jgi:hypothetical protein
MKNKSDFLDKLSHSHSVSIGKCIQSILNRYGSDGLLRDKSVASFIIKTASIIDVLDMYYDHIESAERYNDYLIYKRPAIAEKEQLIIARKQKAFTKFKQASDTLEALKQKRKEKHQDNGLEKQGPFYRKFSRILPRRLIEHLLVTQDQESEIHGEIEKAENEVRKYNDLVKSIGNELAEFLASNKNPSIEKEKVSYELIAKLNNQFINAYFEEIDQLTTALKVVDDKAGFNDSWLMASSDKVIQAFIDLDEAKDREAAILNELVKQRNSLEAIKKEDKTFNGLGIEHFDMKTLREDLSEEIKRLTPLPS